MRFAPHTQDDIREMLSACGLSSLDELFSHLAPTVRLDGGLDMPEGV